MTSLLIRDVAPAEREALGRMMVEVYSALDGFPTPEQQPRYYALLRDIAAFAEKPGARVLVAIAPPDDLAGGVVYFADMAHYGSGGAATALRECSGIRLLGVSPKHRGGGVGKALTLQCIELARDAGHRQVVLHTTDAMRVAWGMYERLGFERAPELDFEQQGFPVRGFRLALRPVQG